MREAPELPGLSTDVLAGDPVSVYLAPDAAVFDSLAPGAPDWSAGIAFPTADRIVLPAFRVGAGGRPISTILRHELAHVALRRYLGDRVPRWFHEGYAQLAARSWNAGDAWKLRLAILAGQTPQLDSLSLDFRSTQLSAENAYLLAYTAVEKLYRLGGIGGFRHLLQSWKETGDLDSGLRRSYGITLGQFEKIWRQDVRDRFGWLLVLSQAVVFWLFLSLVLIGLGIWRIRRRRREMAELRAREIWQVELPGVESARIDGPSRVEEPKIIDVRREET